MEEKLDNSLYSLSNFNFFYLWALSSYSLQDCDRIIKVNVYYYGGNIYLCAGISKSQKNCLLAAGSSMLNLDCSLLAILDSNDLITILCEIRKLYKLVRSTYHSTHVWTWLICQQTHFIPQPLFF